MCTEVLQALRDNGLGSQPEKIIESYRASCYGLHPYALAFMPPGYQDNSVVTTNGDVSSCDHEDMPNEMWAFQDGAGRPFYGHLHFETRRPTEVGTLLHYWDPLPSTFASNSQERTSNRG